MRTIASGAANVARNGEGRGKQLKKQIKYVFYMFKYCILVTANT